MLTCKHGLFCKLTVSSLWLATIMPILWGSRPEVLRPWILVRHSSSTCRGEKERASTLWYMALVAS